MTARVRRTAIAAGAIAALVAVLFFAATEAKARKQPEVQKPAALPAVQLVAVTQVRRAPLEEITGSLVPAKALQLGFEVPGRLAKVAVARGEKVAKGQIVAQLDQEVVRAQVEQAQAALAAAEVSAELASDNAARQGKLQQGGSVSEWQGLASASQAKGAAAQVAAARAALAQARAALSRHTLRAPFAGTIIDAPDQVGATVAPGAPLFTLEDLQMLTLKVTLPESSRDALRKDSQVHIEAIGGSAQTGEARVRTIIPSADAGTRRLPVEIAVPNGDGRFTAHTLARALLPLGDEQAASSLPSTALASAGGDHLFVLDRGTVKKVAVTVLDRGAQLVVVRGLPEGSKVIDSPAIDLAEGSQVELRQ